jgi:hypothetical protein
LVGYPVVVSADEELNYLAFQSWYPDSFVEVLGRDNVGEQQGAMFKYLKNMVLRYFGPESLRGSMLRDVEHAVSSALCTWSTLPGVELKEAVSTVKHEHQRQALVLSADTVRLICTCRWCSVFRRTNCSDWSRRGRRF